MFSMPLLWAMASPMEGGNAATEIFARCDNDADSRACLGNRVNASSSDFVLLNVLDHG